MRKFEERCGQLYIQQKFGGFCHLYIGQEGCFRACGRPSAPPTVSSQRTATTPTPWCWAQMQVRDGRDGHCKKTGTSKGKGGSMHMFDRAQPLRRTRHCWGPNRPRGHRLRRQIPQGRPRHRLLHGRRCARQGMLYETFNMAMTWKLPVISSSRTTNTPWARQSSARPT